MDVEALKCDVTDEIISSIRCTIIIIIIIIIIQLCALLGCVVTEECRPVLNLDWVRGLVMLHVP